MHLMTDSSSQHGQEEDEIKYPRYFPLGHPLPYKYTPCMLSFITSMSYGSAQPNRYWASNRIKPNKAWWEQNSLFRIINRQGKKKERKKEAYCDIELFIEQACREILLASLKENLAIINQIGSAEIKTICFKRQTSLRTRFLLFSLHLLMHEVAKENLMV